MQLYFVPQKELLQAGIYIILEEILSPLDLLSTLGNSLLVTKTGW